MTTLTKEQREAIEWAAGRAHVKALGKPLDGPEGKRWTALRSLLAAPSAGNVDALNKALDRMDRARSILTNDNPRPECNWGMLDTSDLRASVDAQLDSLEWWKQQAKYWRDECLKQSNEALSRLEDEMQGDAQPASGVDDEDSMSEVEAARLLFAFKAWESTPTLGPVRGDRDWGIWVTAWRAAIAQRARET